MTAENQIIRDIKKKMVKGMKNANKLLANDTVKRANDFYNEYEPYYYERTYSLLDAEEIPVTITGDTVSGGVINMANAKGNLHRGDSTDIFNNTMISDPWTSLEVFEQSGYGNHGGVVDTGGGTYVWNDMYGEAEKDRVNFIVEGMKQAGLNITK